MSFLKISFLCLNKISGLVTSIIYRCRCRLVLHGRCILNNIISYWWLKKFLLFSGMWKMACSERWPTDWPASESHDANMEQEGGGGRRRGWGSVGQHSGKSKQSLKKEKKCWEIRRGRDRIDYFNTFFVRGNIFSNIRIIKKMLSDF